MLILNIAFALLAAVCVFFLALGIARVATKNKESEEFSAILSSITRSEVEMDDADRGLPKEKSWTGTWLRLAFDAGWKPETVSTPSRLVLGTMLFAFIGGSLILNPIIGLALALASIFGIRIFFLTKAKARRKMMESQLPNLINGMRANLQANLTPQMAILSQVDEIPSPLGDELKILRQEINVNIPLGTALTNLSYRVPSREIKFLVSSIKTAVESGVDLDPQLIIIQDIITQRTKIANQLASAVASVQPSILVAAVAIPAGFLFSFYSNEENQKFWFSPMGWLALAAIGFMYAIGLFLARLLVKKVEDA